MKNARETQVFLPGERHTILAFTDLHFNEHFGKERLRNLLKLLLETIAREKVEYVCALGDLIDSLAVMDDAELRQEFLGFFENLGKFLPVVLVLGNHDKSRYEGKKALLDPIGFANLQRELNRIPGVFVLGDAQNEIFDDGKVRMLGVDLPDEVYHFSNFQSFPVARLKRSAEAAFREKMAESLPQLKAVPDREYYLLMHSSRFLREVEIDRDVVVLSGHMHDGVMPPVLDKLMRFSGRGLIGPGFSQKNGKMSHYELFPWNARLSPRSGRLWMSLRPVNYLPRDRRVGKLNRWFPDVSFTVIKGGAKKVRVEERILEGGN